MENQQSEISLANFVSERREKIGLSQTGLAKKSNLPLNVIEDIESGNELFLAATIRQKLARGLKLDPKEIKPYEKKVDVSLMSDAQYIEDIKLQILNENTENLKCPVCGSALVCRILEMYDLEDNLVLHPKAHCVKCPFQVR